MVTEKNSITNGMWKFRESVTLSTLVNLAQEWAESSEGDRYLSLIVRRCSKDQLAIWFTYMREDASKESHDLYFEKMTDQLKRQFGNDLAGWDLSSTMMVVK